MNLKKKEFTCRTQLELKRIKSQVPNQTEKDYMIKKNNFFKDFRQ